MELPKIGLSEGGVFDGIKSKLGLGSKNDEFTDGDFDEEAGYDTYDSYDDYDGYDEYDDSAASRDSYSARNSYSAYSSYGTGSSRDYDQSNTGVTRPRLVSIDDVRANTQLEIDSIPSREPKSSDRMSEHAVRGRGSFDFDAPQQNVRSEGLNSLFSSTTDAPAQSYDQAPTQERPAVVSPLSEQPTLRPANMSYGAFTASTAAPQPQQTGAPRRSLVTLKPQSYADVERMAKSVREGSAVILNLLSTQEALSKRLLDFSFGVASALDARVDCIADDVFVICVGPALSATELLTLKGQGAL